HHQRVPVLANDLQIFRELPVLEKEQDVIEDLGRVYLHRRQGARTRVLKEVGDELVEPGGLAQHDLHQAAAGGVGRELADEHLDGPGYRGEGIADLVRDVCGEAAQGGAPLRLG